MDSRLNIKVPASLHRALRIYCVTHSKTLSEVIVIALQRLLGGERTPEP